MSWIFSRRVAEATEVHAHRDVFTDIIFDRIHMISQACSTSWCALPTCLCVLRVSAWYWGKRFRAPCQPGARSTRASDLLASQADGRGRRPRRPAPWNGSRGCSLERGAPRMSRPAGNVAPVDPELKMCFANVKFDRAEPCSPWYTQWCRRKGNPCGKQRSRREQRGMGHDI